MGGSEPDYSGLGEGQLTVYCERVIVHEISCQSLKDCFAFIM